MTLPENPQIPLAFIIVDDPKLTTIFNKALQMANFETEVLSDGKAALQRLSAATPDLIVLDIHLPYISGEDILHWIRQDDRLRATPVVIVTADLFKAKALQREADQVVIKPIGFERLYNLILSLKSPNGNLHADI